MNPPNQSPGDWSAYERQVMFRLDQLDRSIKTLDDKIHERVGQINGRLITMQKEIDHRVETLDDRIDHRIGSVQTTIHDLERREIADLKTEVAMLKLKAGVWGAMAGLIPAAVVVLYQLASGAP